MPIVKIYRPTRIIAPGAVTNFQIQRTGTQYAALGDAAAAAQDNDVILAEPKVYTGSQHIADVSAANLTIKSAVPGSLFRLDVTMAATPKGVFHRTNTGAGSLIIEDAWVNSTPDSSSTGGVWPEGGAYDLIIRRSKFSGCNNGIIIGDHPSATLLCEYVEFDHCGNGESNTHNLYIGPITLLTMLGCYSHGCNAGHLLKSRAKVSTITACRFTDEDGTASYEMEFPCAGDVTVQGCLIEQADNTSNSTIVSYAAEIGIPANCPADGRTNAFRFRQNTVINHRAAGATFFSIGGSPSIDDRTDNIFSGVGAPVITGNTVKSTLASDFVSDAGLDYRPKVSVPGSQNWAASEYVHPLSVIARSDVNRGAFRAQVIQSKVLSDTLSVTDAFIKSVILGGGVSDPSWRVGLTNFAGTTLASTDLTAAQSGFTSPGGTKSHIAAWCGMAISIGGKLYVTGGGHEDYAGNDVYMFDLYHPENGWTRLRDPTASVSDNVAYYSDGRPSADHTYWGFWHINARGILLRVGHPVPWSTAPTPKGNVDGFDLSGNDWQTAGTYPTQSGTAMQTCGQCKDTSENIYVHNPGTGGPPDAGHLFRWNQVANTWTDLGDMGGTESESAIAYDSTRDRIFRVGTASPFVSACVFTNIHTGSATKTNITLTGASAGNITNGCSVTYDSINDCFWAIQWGNATLYKINPSTWAVTTQSMTGTALRSDGLPDGGAYIHSRFSWHEALRGIVYMPDADRNIVFIPTSA